MARLDPTKPNKQNTWTMTEARAKFSALARAAERDGPQFITVRGVVALVFVPAEYYDGLVAGK
jgi:prevent-host-death family protein